MEQHNAGVEGASAPSVVSTVEQLEELVEVCLREGRFCFDVETKGNVDRHPDVSALFEEEWKSHLSSLKTTNSDILERSRESLESKWRSEIALDPLRNEVFWIGIATRGRSWAIPMGHPHGSVLEPEERGDGSTVPPPGYRTILKTGKESLAKARYYKPAVFSTPPEQLDKSTVFESLKPLFFSGLTKIGHNVKFDARSIAKYYDGIPPGPYRDTMLMQHVLNENLSEYSLDKLLNFNFDGLNAYKRHGKLGSIITQVSFAQAVEYVHLDVRWTWLLHESLWRRIKRHEDLSKCLAQDMEVLHVLMHMENNGIHVDHRSMKKLGKELESKLSQLHLDMMQYSSPGFNPDSTKHKQTLLFTPKKEGGLGLKPVKETKGGSPSVDEESLRKLENKHPVIPMLIDWAETKKMKSTYVEGLLQKLNKGKLHPSFHLHRTTTGRMSSCVSGDTLLTTSRGTFRFDEYLPEEGDLVPTHTGSWKPVLRKIYKGVSPMVSVHLDNGSVLKCTEAHRLLTPTGWVQVSDLLPGSEVFSHVGVKLLYVEPGQHQSSAAPVSGGRKETHQYPDSQGVGYNLSQRDAHHQYVRGWGASQDGEGTSVLTLQDGKQEPDVRQVHGAAPQLHWCDKRWSWVFDEEGRWEVRPRTSVRVCPGVGTPIDTLLAGGASHQWGQARQPDRQPGIGDRIGAWGASSEVSRVREITPVGEVGVWDIEVADDHSYVTHGFVNHNSNPNLQNIPRDSSVRGLFVAPPGHSLLVADYDQIELRVMCMFSGDKKMSEFFLTGADIHSGAAALILDKDPLEVTDEERQMGKGVNFLTAYGGGAQKLAATTGVSVDRARYVIDRYYQQFKGITTWKQSVLRIAAKQGYVSTLSGRRRRLEDIKSSNGDLRARAERQAINSVVQGSAADICKEAMIDVYDAFKGTSAKMLVQVHDELVVSVPTEEINTLMPVLVEAMGHGRIISGIPLKVSCHSAGSWSEAKGK